jgi:multidrug transporter EmrE-like cation transporter
MGRTYMSRYGFKLSTFISLWFLAYLLIRQIATFGQVYIFANIQLGKTMAVFGAVSIVMSNVIGLLYLGEKLSPVSYFGICLAILAFLIMGFK